MRKVESQIITVEQPIAEKQEENIHNKENQAANQKDIQIVDNKKDNPFSITPEN